MKLDIRFRAALKTSASLGALCVGLSAAAMPTGALANPVGGTVTTGSAAISSPSSKQTNVDQKSEGVVIDWKSFDIGSGQTTKFVQPNSSAIAVNRIGGASASRVLGTLDANGRIVLINGNGIVFGKGSQVDVGSLIATTTDGSDSDLLAGKFTKAGNQGASIVNRGDLDAAAHGTVALVAPNVTNKGTIEAKLGTVSLGGANAFTVDFAGDGLVSFAAQGDVNGKASAINAGKLVGANVSMTAHAAEGIATGVVNTGGIIEAEGVNGTGGTILLDANNGRLETGGTINAAGKTGGGQIETSGADVSIAGKITAGKGGLWKVDPDDLTIDSAAASTIDLALDNGTSVLEQTTASGTTGYGNVNTSGNGDIFVEAPISWNTGATLTLDAYHSLNILAPITVAGGGSLVLQYNDALTTGALSFGLGPSGFAGNVSYAVGTGEGIAGQSLKINNNSYTLLYSATDLENLNSSNTTLAGTYALADSLDLTGVSWTPVGLQGHSFTGNFEGLGNTISNLTIDDASDDYVGLFGVIYGGALRDVALVNESVTSTAADANVGGLVGSNGGTIEDVAVGGTVSGGTGNLLYAGIGGLAGTNYGSVWQSYSTASVTGGQSAAIGGLIGANYEPVSQSYATGSVSDTLQTDAAGGLIGYNLTEASYEWYATVTQSHATGAVTAQGDAGGLIGLSENSTLSQDYATGAVTSPRSGGLIGFSEFDSISQSYASGTVSGATAGGLVGQSASNISQSYATGAVSGGSAGGLVGMNGTNGSGTITQSYATGAVTSTSIGGGLVGVNGGYNTVGTVSQSYATGAVTGGDGGVIIGGLVGYNSGGSVSQSYATGTATTGEAGYVGGLIGFDYTAGVSQSYATGAVTGGTDASIGGLIGYDSSAAGSITNSYWDMSTTGITNASQGAGSTANDSGITGDTTAQLQAGLPSGFSNTAWSSVAGTSYPYLSWQFTGTPEVVSGIVTKSGTTAQTGADVALLVDGTSVTPDLEMSSGANGYYYVLLAPGTISGPSQVFAYLPSGSPGNAYYQDATGSLANLNITEKKLEITSDQSTASGMIAGLNAAVGSGTGPQFLYTQGGGFITGTDDLVTDTAASFTIDTTLDFAANTAKITAAGPVVETTGLIDAKELEVSSVGNITLGGSNDLAELGGFSTGGATGNINVNDTASVIVEEKIDAGYGTGTLTLTSGGAITEGSGGDLDAGTFEGSSVGAATFGSTNNVASIGGFTATGGSFTLSSDESFTISGTLNAGSKATLASAGTIGETGAGAIDATTFTGSSVGGTTLNGANLVTDLGAFSNTGAGGFALTNAQNLTVNGVVNSGTGDLDLTTTGSGNNITIDAGITAGGTADLVTTGALTQSATTGIIAAGTLAGSAPGATSLLAPNQIAALGSFTNTGGGLVLTNDQNLTITGTVNVGSHIFTLNNTGTVGETTGAIDGGGFTGSSAGGATLNGSNLLSDLDAFTNTGAGGFALTNAQALTVNGAVKSGTGDLDLTTTGSGSNITIDAGITAGGTADLVATGTLTQNTTTGVITAATLAGSSAGATTLRAANLIGALGSFTNTGGGLVLTNDQNLTISGTVNVGSHIFTLTDTGTVGETGSGVIDAATLTGSSVGGATLNGANLLSDLGAFTNTGAGGFALTNAQALTVTGTVNSGTGDLDLTTTGSGNNITIDAGITAGGTADLVSTGALTQSATAGIITAGTLAGSATGATSLLAPNQIAALGSFTNTGGGLQLTNDQNLTISGTVNVGSHIFTLNNTGTVGETGSGAIDAAALTGSSVGGATLNGANLLSDLDVFTNTGAGGFALTNGQTLIVNGSISAGSGNADITVSSGDLDLGYNIAGDNITLISSLGKVKQTAGSLEATDVLTVEAYGNVILDGDNTYASEDLSSTNGHVTGN